MFNLVPPRILPDHSILSGKFATSFYDYGKNYENACPNNSQSTSEIPINKKKKAKKNLSKINETFFMSEEIHNLVLLTINKLENKVNTKNELDQLWLEIKNIFLKEMDKLPSIPTSSSKKQKRKFRKSQLFWNDELERLWADTCNAEKKYLNFKVRTAQDHGLKNELRISFKTIQKSFDKKFRYFQRQYKKTEYSNLETNAKSKPASMWEQLKRLDNPPTTRAALEIVRGDDTISRDLKEILARWFKDISQLFSGLREDPDVAFDDDFYQEVLNKKAEFENMSYDQQSQQCEYTSDDLNIGILYDEVSEAIDKSNLRKSYLEIPNEVMKNKNAKLLLFKFFNLCFISGLNPSDWDFSDIIPIPKKDKDARDPLQNRCITIVCCVAKIYSSILNKRLQKYLEANKILADEQNGFRAGRSCIDHIYVMCTVLRNRKLLGKETFLCFIDFKKAFDSVDRNLLLFKLSNIGVNGHMYTAISSLYSNPKSRVILQDYETEYFDCPIGVKQGDCLSPTLFAIFINDLANEIKDAGVGVTIDIGNNEDIGNTDNIDSRVLVNILLYADDIVLFASNEIDLQHLLNIVEIWCGKWRLEVNLTKTNILHIRNKRKSQSKFMFLFNRNSVSYCNYYKYLGCTINEFLDFTYTAQVQADSAGRALSSIITKMIKNQGFPFNVYSILYKACVTSISEYGSEVFGFEQFDCTFKLHLRAARAFLGLPKNVTSFGLVSELDWLLPQSQMKLRMIRHFGRLLKTDNTRLMKKIYLWDKYLNETEQITTWSSEIKSILYENNLNQVYDSQQIFQVKIIVKQLEESLFKKQQIIVENVCRTKPKLRTFVTFKDFQTISPHVYKPLSFIERKTISKARLGILPIRLETARYVRPIVPEDQRLCYCTTGEPETEYHVLFICEKYSNLRQLWMDKITKPDNFDTMSRSDQFKIVLNEPSNVKYTAQFLIDLLDLRRLLNNLY